MTNLKRIIDEKGVQQRWLAEQVGVTEVSMSRYVNGERIPKAPMAIRMADVLGVDVKELYGWDDKHVVGEPEQPETHEERTETHGVCLDTISRQAAIDAILAVTGNSSVRELYEHVQEHGLSDMWSGGVNAAIDVIIAVPSAQPTLHGYNIEHLELIARVLQKENLPPERVVEALTDIGRIVAIVSDEFNETLRKAVEQCMT